MSAAHEPVAAQADPRHRFLRQSGWFDPDWYAARAPVPIAPGTDVLEHYLTHGAPAGIAPNAWIDRLQDPPDRASSAARAEEAPQPPELDDPQLRREVQLIRDSGLFDARFYAKTHRRLIPDGVDPLVHFCQVGWRQVLRPRLDFDPWWYWINHLDPTREDLNPFLHYVLLGRAAGHAGVKDRVELPIGAPGPADRPRRRVCLFAGYDDEGILDDHVVEYVRELSRFADVFYLCDGYLPPDQLARLDGVAAGAWAVRHGAYDFGSYSMLARDLVGWERIEQYDELLFVNDSCYLLGALDPVFARMDAGDCAWWGLQATKGIFLTRAAAKRFTDAPIPMTQVRERLTEFEQDPVYDFLVGSYFLAYRRPVFTDVRFRRVMDSMHEQRDKLQVILRYEIGLTHYLVGAGYSFDTFIDSLYPFHPVFTEWYFELLAQGFPLLKRYLLYQNHYDVPDLRDWKDRVLAVFPDAPVETFEQNLLRTAPDDRLRRSFSIRTRPDGTVSVPARASRKELRLLDRTSPVFEHWWAFPVDAKTHRLPDNSRAILEVIRDDPSITKIILTRSKRVEMRGENLIVAPLASAEGQRLLVRAGQVIMAATPRATLMRRPLDWDTHRLVLVRDGLRLQRGGTAITPVGGPQRSPRREIPEHPVRGLLTSSEVDQVAVLAEHYPATYRSCWRTGVPAHDFLLQPEDRLPDDLRRDLDRIRDLLGDRRLVLFAPGRGRSTDDVAYRFDDAELAELRAWAERHRAVLGLREHPLDLERAYRRRLGPEVLDLPAHRFPVTAVVLRAASALLTDVSGTALDFLVTGRPVLSFVHDLEAVEPDLVDDVEHIMPAPVARDFEALLAGLDGLFAEPDEELVRRYQRSRRLLIEHSDGLNARRAVARIRGGYLKDSR